MITVAEAAKKMIDGANGNLHDIAHFMKVWSYAKTIGELEGLDPETQFILEITALMHDIGIPISREKYGNTEGPNQEREGAIAARPFLEDSGLTEEQIDRVCFMIGHHHTPGADEGIDFRILLEADYLVNADESAFSAANIRNTEEKIFRTASGKALLESIYRQRLRTPEASSSGEQ